MLGISTLLTEALFHYVQNVETLKITIDLSIFSPLENSKKVHLQEIFSHVAKRVTLKYFDLESYNFKSTQQATAKANTVRLNYGSSIFSQ